MFCSKTQHCAGDNFNCNLERTSNSFKSTRPVGGVILEELLEEVILLPYVLYCIRF